MNSDDFDEKMMLHALELAMRGRITAPPNPWVGCVIVKNGQIIGEGFHHAAGQAHAEVNALLQAGSLAEGATAYVTLEPCAHFGRTPPCSLALIKAQVARVVVGLLDPDRRVSGKGIAQLQAAGITVTHGIAAAPLKKALAPYLHQRKTGRPYCIAKSAISVDGRVGASDGTSKWISSEEARLDAHQLRAESQAIMIGSGTALTDLPALTVRDVQISPKIPPLRVVLSASGNIPVEGPLFDTTLAPTLILTTTLCPTEKIKKWEQKHVEVHTIPAAQDEKGIDLNAALELLGARGILQVLIEGGGGLLGSFLKSKQLQHLRLYVGPHILGNLGLPLFRDDYITTLADSPRLTLIRNQTLGTTVRLDYEIDNE